MAVTPEMVEEIIQVKSTISLTPFITAAEALSGKVLASVEDYDADYIDLINTWLSAHFYAIRDPRKAGENLDFMQYKYKDQFKLGLNLESTMYGQQVLLLDVSGSYSQLNNQAGEGKKRLGVVWLGTESETST